MATLTNWPEIETMLSHKRFELVLKSAKDRNPDINDEKLQDTAFPVGSVINHLTISESGLLNLSVSIKNCSNLTNLVLKNNQLPELPSEIGSLINLKLIDVSGNELTSLPQSMAGLVNLQTLDIARNKLMSDGLFDLSGLVMLHILEASHNSLTTFPVSMTSENLVKLHTINLSSNQIEQLPFEFSNVAQLKDFKIEKNLLKEIPLCLALHQKLVKLDLRENPFDDRRFRKLANDPRAKVPAILDYIRKKLAEQEIEKKQNSEENATNENDSEALTITIHTPNTTVKVLESVRPIRPHLLTCIIRNLNLGGGNFRKFINLQNRLHQLECGQRTLATIGTHDLSAVKLPLRYLALPHDNLFITALHKKVPVSARELISALVLDAELARKREKRSQINPVHRYLHLVKDLPLMACLIDAEGLVISLAPLTNSDLTKMNESTSSILVEVSSQESLSICQQVMTTLIEETLSFSPSILIDQMRVMSEDDNLMAEYPARSSLPAVNKRFVEHPV